MALAGQIDNPVVVFLGPAGRNRLCLADARTVGTAEPGPVWFIVLGEQAMADERAQQQPAKQGLWRWGKVRWLSQLRISNGFKQTGHGEPTGQP